MSSTTIPCAAPIMAIELSPMSVELCDLYLDVIARGAALAPRVPTNIQPMLSLCLCDVPLVLGGCPVGTCACGGEI